jgi:hypothetical protein
MNVLRISRRYLALIFSIAAVSAQAATITGTVTNKTTNKPSAGDTVSLIDVQAGMSEAASATTNASGEYSLDAPGMGAYLIRVNHQGGTYFIAAPQNGGPGDVTVFDVAPKVDGVSIDADMFLVEAAGGMLRVHERFLVRNTSLPPKAQFSDNTFEIVIPTDAEVDSASATRPGGLATNTRVVPLSQKGHFTFNIPIQPNKGEKETLFEVQYHLPYNGKYLFTPHPQIPADNLVVYLPKGIDFKAGRGASFQPVQEDPKVQTFIMKNVRPGQAIEFAVAGEGQMPRQEQPAGMGGQMGMGDGDSAGGAGNRPGGGIGAPIDTPDPLTKYKWWILSGLALLLIAASAFLLRKRADTAPHDASSSSALATESRPVPAPVPSVLSAQRVPSAEGIVSTQAGAQAQSPAPLTHAALLSLVKDELFAIESERLSGSLAEDEYARIRVGLEALLKRALNR